MLRTLAAATTAALATACSTGTDTPADEGATVARIGDGDTIELASGARVRLVQIDAPELGEGECFGREASVELAELLPPGTAVRLEPDPRLDDTDRFGRLLRYVHRGDVNVNLELVRRGAASVWFFAGDRGRYSDELLAAAREAERLDRGLWGACPAAALDPERGVQTR